MKKTGLIFQSIELEMSGISQNRLERSLSEFHDQNCQNGTLSCHEIFRNVKIELNLVRGADKSFKNRFTLSHLVKSCEAYTSSCVLSRHTASISPVVF